VGLEHVLGAVASRVAGRWSVVGFNDAVHPAVDRRG